MNSADYCKEFMSNLEKCLIKHHLVWQDISVLCYVSFVLVLHSFEILHQ